MPAAALSEQSARLGDGLDSYAHGVIARVNALAHVLGVREGMPCAEAAMRLLQAPPGVLGRGAAAVDTRGAIVYEGLEGTVTALVSVSFATSAHTGHVLCAGSHTAAVTGRYVAAYAFPVAGIIGNDAGVGKDQSGIAGLALLQASGIPAASVAALSACIGSGQSTYAARNDLLTATRSRRSAGCGQANQPTMPVWRCSASIKGPGRSAKGERDMGRGHGVAWCRRGADVVRALPPVACRV